MLLLAARFSPVLAQYNPPPPPEEQNTGGEPPDQPMQPPQGQDQPGPDDQGGPPPGADMQDAPSPDQDAPDAGAPPDAQDQSGGDVNFQTFYNDLSSQGNWVQTDNYGYVWQPNENDPDWRPYSNGHWVYTDEGWTWVADNSEPWGWATYHYGRWANLDGYGWVWVPGYTWAPAWVSWRYGGGYCGWAPLPPDTFIGIDFGDVSADFHIGGDCDIAFDIGPGYYNFIPIGYIGERDYRHHYLDRNNNFTIIASTRNVTNIYVNHQRVAGRFSRVSVGGPDIATVNAQAGTPVERVRLARSNRAGNASLSGSRLAVFAPRVSSANTGIFRPSRVAGTVANARVNTGANINQPLAVTARVHANGPSSAQIAAAQNARFSSSARVATPGTHPTAALTEPLTSYHPRTDQRTTSTHATVQTQQTVSSEEVHASRQEDAFTGENAPEVHHAQTTSEANPTFSNANAESHVRENVVTPQAQTQAQVQHQDYHPQAEVQHTEVHPQEVQHQDFHPQQEHHDAAPANQHTDSHPQAEHHDAAPASHPSGGGGDANHSNGNKNGDGKDNSQNHR